LTEQTQGNNVEEQIKKLREEQELWLIEEKKKVDEMYSKGIQRAQDEIQEQRRLEMEKAKSEITSTIQKEIEATLSIKKEEINQLTKKEYLEYCSAIDEQTNEKLKVIASETEDQLQKYISTQRLKQQEENYHIQQSFKQFQESEELRLAKGIFLTKKRPQLMKSMHNR
jgi:hypothetical protein